MATVKAVCWDVLLSGKNCIFINRKGKYHVRRYRRDVPNGMSIIKADYYSYYMNDSLVFAPVFTGAIK